eukprot:scaffold10344_cov62-Phaeocystis_antarctica.AAC.6
MQRLSRTPAALRAVVGVPSDARLLLWCRIVLVGRMRDAAQPVAWLSICLLMALFRVQIGMSVGHLADSPRVIGVAGLVVPNGVVTKLLPTKFQR